MKLHPLLLIALFLAMAVNGCSTTPKEDSDDWRAKLPPAEITRVAWNAGTGGNAEISGVYFKHPSNSKFDVMASLNCRNWAPAKGIGEATGTHYSVTLPYGSNLPQVWVRVFGMNGKYSEPFIVEWRRQ